MLTSSSATLNPSQVLGAMFTMGLIFASFVFAALASIFNEMRLLGYGMLIWGVGTLGTGLSRSFGAMIVFRVRQTGQDEGSGWSGLMPVARVNADDHVHTAVGGEGD